MPTWGTNKHDMHKSESIQNIAKALVAFQGEMENVTKDAVNPFFKSKYATLENIINTAKPHLKKHGLAFAQFPTGENELTTILIHESGEFIQSTAKMLVKEQTPQGQGSALTYFRRYCLSAALGIAVDEDDDGNEASQPLPKPGAHKAPVITGKPKAEKKDLAQKLRIMTLMKELGQEIDKATAQDKVRALTGLELIEEAYPVIISRLEALVDEKNSK